MKEYTTDKIRNIALIAHGGTGKTSLIEGVLFNCKHTSRMGTIEAGTTVCDTSPDEIKRQTTIRTKVVPCEWKDKKINLLDTPGYADFTGDILTALRVVDTAAIMVCAASGIQVGTEKAFRFAKSMNLPKMIFINKIDRENVDFKSLLDKLTRKFGSSVTPIIIPMGNGPQCRGVIDIIQMKAYSYNSGDPNFKERIFRKNLKQMPSP
ncbi:MAG: GTP-binding protein [bacterium]